MFDRAAIEPRDGEAALGRLAVESILSKDFPVVQGTVLLGATVYILVNLLVDLSYAYLDPRITLRRDTV